MSSRFIFEDLQGGEVGDPLALCRPAIGDLSVAAIESVCEGAVLQRSGSYSRDQVGEKGWDWSSRNEGGKAASSQKLRDELVSASKGRIYTSTY
jgi:hypothetical protein